MDKLEQGYQLFRTWLCRHDPHTEEIWPIIKPELQYEKVPKNHLLLQHGEKENRIRFLLSGLVKASYHTDKNSFVYTFRERLDICCVASSLFGDAFNDFSLQTVIRTDYLYIEKPMLNGLLSHTEGLDNLLLKISNKYTEQLYQYRATQRSYNAEERLKLFAHKHPDVMRYAKNKDIASVLEITPQTLSKLRSKGY